MSAASAPPEITFRYASRAFRCFVQPPQAAAVNERSRARFASLKWSVSVDGATPQDTEIESSVDATDSQHRKEIRRAIIDWYEKTQGGRVKFHLRQLVYGSPPGVTWDAGEYYGESVDEVPPRLRARVRLYHPLVDDATIDVPGSYVTQSGEMPLSPDGGDASVTTAR